MTTGKDQSETKQGKGIPQEVGAGLFLLFIAAVGLFGSLKLNFGRLSEIGPGLFPISMSVLLGCFGVFLLILGLTKSGEVLTKWNIRGLVCVLAAVLFFAIFIRGMTIEMFGLNLKAPALGMLICVPAAIMISSMADAETKIREVAGFAIFMTFLCGFLFKDMLALPIPFDPAGVIPDVIAQSYAGLKKSIVALVSGLFGR